MKKCEKCGYENKDEDTWCSMCGQQLGGENNFKNTEVQPPKHGSTLLIVIIIAAAIIIALISIIIAFTLSPNGAGSSAGTTKETETTVTYTEKPTEMPAPTIAPTPKATISMESLKKSIIEKRAKVIKENYGYVEYSELARNPNNYKGKSLMYEGKILQVLEDHSIEGLNYLNILLVVGNSYDNIVKVTYTLTNDEPRILEDDYVHVYGTSDGLYSYKTVRGNENTIPKIEADLIE